ncbi:MAG: FG-GAP repeat protein, partial [Acidobacteriota bacterium]|nr:FG-GAP repeat protein [Acidobacteriota bacterium]
NYTAAGVNAGSVYVFVRSNGQWSQQVKLTASDAAKDDKFGFSVGISGDTAVVGVANWQSAVVSAYVKRLINIVPF